MGTHAYKAETVTTKTKQTFPFKSRINMAIPSHLVASKERRTVKKRSCSDSPTPNPIALINRLSLSKRTNVHSPGSLTSEIAYTW